MAKEDPFFDPKVIDEWQAFNKRFRLVEDYSEMTLEIEKFTPLDALRVQVTYWEAVSDWPTKSAAVTARVKQLKEATRTQTDTAQDGEGV